VLLRQIHDEKLAQYAYLIGCQATGEALLIDPERDVDRYLEAAEREGLRITAVAETHIHADFLSGARELAERLDVQLYLSAEGGPDWQVEWVRAPRLAGGAYRATLLRHGDVFHVGNVELRALHTPGHTPEHLSFLVSDGGAGASAPIGIATGDFVFVGDLGRPDLLEQAAGIQGVQEDAARTLHRALARFDALDDHVQLWPGHGAGSACGKALGAVPTSTVGYEKRHNAALAAARRGEDAFVEAILTDQPEPPTYFARMKRQNRAGPPLRGELPRPAQLSAQELAARLADPELVVVDTRLDRAAFMARHLPGSLYARLDRTFPTVVGSLVVDETRPLLLIVEAEELDEAVRDLVRIGYDRIAGFVDLRTLERHWAQGGARAAIPTTDMRGAATLGGRPGYAVVDVRSGAEHRADHAPGSALVPYTRLPLATGRLPDADVLVVHCQTGSRSAPACAYLAAEGRRVVWVGGDWSEWKEAGQPVARAIGPDGDRGNSADAAVAAGRMS
jgi:hydroxyacylglutathione hydrolase